MGRWVGVGGGWGVEEEREMEPMDGGVMGGLPSVLLTTNYLLVTAYYMLLTTYYLLHGSLPSVHSRHCPRSNS